ncbi:MULTISPECIES: N-acetylmuramoyl-L-alanine amidase [unclassified Streptomyces]|uniref:N-acetylmuramoyl-L-alanine amidase n=1 Tax=unclassified Streptomyces TaxID=2593676 RepID=UPI0035DD1601
MATPMTAETLMKVLKDEGLNVVGVKSWKTHNRAGHGAWGPINGVIMHHTVTKGTDASVNICYNGHATLPGPLCHGVIDKDGTVYLVSAGRANHAGLGDGNVLSAVVAEKKPPVDKTADTDGNSRFYGFECVNLGDGKDPWPDVQVDAMVKAAAAICRHYGWKAASVIGHKEWQPGKIDPKGPAFDDMDAFRARITKQLGDDKPSTPSKPPTSKPSTKPSVSLAHVVSAARKDPGAPQGKTTYKAEVLLVEKALVAEGLLASKWADGSYGTLTLAAYKRWQNRCGYFTADTADGIPGKTTLARLADRHGFTVKG